jgi:hypothetical protein
MTRVLRGVALGAALCALAGCGVRPTGVVNAGEAPTATATSLPHTQVYFLLNGTLTPVPRTVAPWDTQAVFDALLAGPTPQESAHGLRTQLTPDVTIRAIGPRAVFVEYANAFAKQAMTGYEQIYCTALLLPGAPIVRVPEGLDQKLQSATEQKLRAANVCPGVALPPEAGGVSSPSDEPSPRADGTFPSEAPTPGGAVTETQPPAVPAPEGGYSKKPRFPPKPSRTG